MSRLRVVPCFLLGRQKNFPMQSSQRILELRMVQLPKYEESMRRKTILSASVEEIVEVIEPLIRVTVRFEQEVGAKEQMVMTQRLFYLMLELHKKLLTKTAANQH